MKQGCSTPVTVGADHSTTDLPILLAELHRHLTSGDVVDVVLAPEPEETWTPVRALDLLVGAGFELLGSPKQDSHWVKVRARRIRSLPDTVGPDMRILMVGLNPSPASADSGIGYARPGNRFWPAILEAGLASVDRDPLHALTHHGIGMTDLVRRTTRRADEIDRDEYRAGRERVERLVDWLQPRTVCFVGLSGWRITVNRQAVAGIQPVGFGGRPAYVMPHTSGLNAHSKLSDLVSHLRSVNQLAETSST